MIKSIIMAIVIYLATSIDEIPVLFMLYMDARNKGKGKIITFSYFIGTFLLVAIGMLGALGLVMLPAKWILGFIGLIPIIMGIKILITGDDDDEKAVDKSGKIDILGIKVLVITFALGADDLGVYIPLFTTLTSWEMLQTLLVFASGTLLLCLISYRLTSITRLTSYIEKWEKYIVGTIFIAIGIWVMIKCGTFSSAISYLI